MQSQPSKTQKYLRSRISHSAERIIDKIALEGKADQSIRLDWRKMSVTCEEFGAAVARFDAVPRPVGILNEKEAAWLAGYFDGDSVAELKRARVKTLAGTCSCGRVLNVYDILRKAIELSVHSVDFMKQVLNGRIGRFVVSARDGTDEEIAAMPSNTIWIDNTKPIECTACGQPHQTLLAMGHFMHNWVLMLPDA